MEALSVKAEAALLAQHRDDQPRSPRMVVSHLLAQRTGIPSVAGEKQYVRKRHGRLRCLILGARGAVEGCLHPAALELAKLTLHLAPKIADHHIVRADEGKIVLREHVIGKHALVVIAENALSVNQTDLRDGSLSLANGQVRHVHTLLGNGAAHQRAKIIIPDRADIGGLAAQTHGVDGHIDRTAARIGFSALHILIKIHAVASNRSKFHILTSQSSKRILSGRRITRWFSLRDPSSSYLKPRTWISAFPSGTESSAASSFRARRMPICLLNEAK